MNTPLVIFDIIISPIILIRFAIIYIFGSKYNIPNMRFLDVMAHAEKPYFNQEGEPLIDTTTDDIRCVIRDDTRLYNFDIDTYITNHNLKFNKNNKINEIVETNIHPTQIKHNLKFQTTEIHDLDDEFDDNNSNSSDSDSNTESVESDISESTKQTELDESIIDNDSDNSSTESNKSNESNDSVEKKIYGVKSIQYSLDDQTENNYEKKYIRNDDIANKMKLEKIANIAIDNLELY